MPGAVAVILVSAVVAWRVAHSGSGPPFAFHRWRALCLAGSAAAALIALIPFVAGPVAYELGPVQVSITRSFKPLTVAIVFFAAWCLTSASSRRAWQARSPFGFYVLATLAMWALAFGPTARLFGHRVFYKAPYSWLMVFPGFSDAFRAPARFAMLAALTLSVAGALAFRYLMRGQRESFRRAAVVIVAAAVVIESWIGSLALLPPPQPLTTPDQLPASAVIAELPTGLFEDASAMYRSMFHGRPTVNGLSGYQPPHYGVLSAAIGEGRAEALAAIAESADVAIFLPHGARGDALSDVLAMRTGTRAVATTATHRVWILPRVPRASPAVNHNAIDNLVLHSDLNTPDLRLMVDGDLSTAWVSPRPQTGDEVFVADAGQSIEMVGVVLSLSNHVAQFPRTVGIDVSADMKLWTEVGHEDTAAMTVAAAIDRPAEINVELRFRPTRARFIRVRQTGRSPYSWAVAELRILRAP